MAAPDHRGARRLGPRPSRGAGRALCGQPDRPQIQRPADGGHGDLRRNGRCRSSSPRSARSSRSTRACTRWGGITLHDIINDRFARKAVEKGADGIIAVAAGAGGHAGRLSPFAADPGDPRLVRRAADPVGRDRHRPRDPRRPGDGRRPRLYRLALHRHRRGQCDADYKQGICDGRADDIVYSSLFTGVHGNYLQEIDRAAPASTPPTCPKATSRRWISAPATARRPRPGATSGAPARASARSTRCCPAGDYVARLIAEYAEARRRFARIGSIRASRQATDG